MRRVGRPGLVGLAARTAVVAGTATAVSGSVARHQQQRAQDDWEQQQYEAQQQQAAMNAAAQQAVQQQMAQQPPPAAAAPSGGGDDVLGQLQRLADLKAQGILTDEEFAAAKAKLLS